jgi:hypothetical protein
MRGKAAENDRSARVGITSVSPRTNRQALITCSALSFVAKAFHRSPWKLSLTPQLTRIQLAHLQLTHLQLVH